MKKTIFITLSISLLAALPAIAQVGNVWVDFQNYANDLQLYLKDNISDTLLPVESEAQTAINSYNGELNIPNPIAARRSLIDDIVINSLSNNFENNPAVNAKLSANEVDRQLTRSIAVGILGEEAQIRSRNKLENIENSLENTTRDIQQRQEDSQNLFDDIAETAINASNPLSGLLNQSQSTLIALQLQNNEIENEQSKMIAENLVQTMQLHQSLQYSNLNLANISQEIEESNRSRRVKASAEAARLLRTTSQVDLFGRSKE
ncbi:hypothetical protein Riv7116_3918 [Rivularia sp. PCC 7116]|uniref:hypothetical protein n=1 Tax=Rivularia sp. PCC 7116 TaxID=373994 RepID=UPI00029F381F|nr:hypothetical protein [Rivularia sp. PCC 7116]AFY56360.1 hypothetical protein Riv7116_3918 [Rivularia sp. PCC 7116]